MPDPLVSVIVPTYNRVDYLQEAVASVYAQTQANWELVIVDDGSTDGTRPYLEGLTDPRVHPILLEHCGNPARLRNVAIERSTGAYLALLDSDDVWLPQKLERQLAAFTNRPGARWGYTYHVRMYADGDDAPTPPWHGHEAHAGWILRAVISTEAWIAVATVMIERALAVEVGGFDETLPASEDYELFVRLARASEACLVPDPLTRVRLHAGGRAAAREIEVFETWAAVIGRLSRDPRYAAHRAFCRRQYARASVWLADRYRRRREHGRALRVLARAFRYQPTLPAWWAALVKTGVRALVASRR